MSLDSDLSIKDLDVIIWTAPGFVAERAKSKYSLISVDKLDLISPRLLHHYVNVVYHVAIERNFKIYNLFHPSNVFELNTMLKVSSVNKRSWGSDIRKLSMKHYSSLFERQMSPVL
jgi:hypothetical protein